MFNNLYNTCTYNYVCKQVHTCPCLPHRTNGRLPVREKHVHTHIPAYQTTQMADCRSERNTFTHTSLPTRPHKWQIAGQGETHIYTHTSLPTRPHKWQIAGQRETHIYTHTFLPTRQHKWQTAGQRETHMYTHTHIHAYQTAQMADRRSGRNTRTHTYILAYIPDLTDSSSLVRKKYTYMYTYRIGLQVLLKSIYCIAEAVAVAGLTLQRFSPLVWVIIDQGLL